MLGPDAFLWALPIPPLPVGLPRFGPKDGDTGTQNQVTWDSPPLLMRMPM